MKTSGIMRRILKRLARGWRRHGITPHGAVWVGLLLALGAVLWLRTEFGVVLVVGQSMFPTLRSGDLLVVHRGTYDEAAPVHGDIVVAKYRSEWIVKRVVGVPGDEVEVMNGEVVRNGRILPAGHPIHPGRLRVHRGVLAEDRFALLGDNRAATDGLLFYAVVPRERFMGRVVGVLHLGGRPSSLAAVAP